MNRAPLDEMLRELPADLAAALQPLFEALPLERAMPELLPQRSQAPLVKIVDTLVGSAPLKGRLDLQAGLWLYVDELERSHRLSQALHDLTGSYWHGIMHRREGDFGNAKYWFRSATAHPGMAGEDPIAFVDEVAQRHPGDPPDLLDRQRAEWARLFAWCAAQPA